MTENEPAGGPGVMVQKPAQHDRAAQQAGDVRGYAMDDDDLGDEPPPAPPVLPLPGAASITGWPDPGPPRIDPPTQAAWLRPRPDAPETPERP
jgi:hypothetical protein